MPKTPLPRRTRFVIAFKVKDSSPLRQTLAYCDVYQIIIPEVGSMVKFKSGTGMCTWVKEVVFIPTGDPLVTVICKEVIPTTDSAYDDCIAAVKEGGWRVMRTRPTAWTA